MTAIVCISCTYVKRSLFPTKKNLGHGITPVDPSTPWRNRRWLSALSKCSGPKTGKKQCALHQTWPWTMPVNPYLHVQIMSLDFPDKVGFLIYLPCFFAGEKLYCISCIMFLPYPLCSLGWFRACDPVIKFKFIFAGEIQRLLAGCWHNRSTPMRKRMVKRMCGLCKFCLWGNCPISEVGEMVHCLLIQVWVCLKMGYTPNYSHLVGIMIINHWV